MNRSQEKPNVLLIVMDTTRARTVTRGITEGFLPNLAQFTDKAYHFENCFTTAPWTLPSHASLFTGQYTSGHGVHAGSPMFNPGSVPLPERLQAAGYQIAGFSNNPWISTEYGFDRAFDEFYERWKLFEGSINIKKKIQDRESLSGKAAAVLGDMTIRNAIPTFLNAIYNRYLQHWYDNGALLTNLRLKRWLRNRSTQDGPFFAFVNYLEPHLEYRPPTSYASDRLPEDGNLASVNELNQDAWAFITGEVQMDGRDFDGLQSLYEAELCYLDARIGALLEFLRGEGLYENTMIIITGDHGENIGDHGLMDHQYALYDSLLRVPLFISDPEGMQGVTDDSLIELRDLYPTITEAAGGSEESDPSISTNSLLGAIRSGERVNREQVFAEYRMPQPAIETLYDRYDVSRDIQQFDRQLRAIRTDDWKCIQGSDGTVELFDVSSDPEESRNLVSEEQELADRLCEELERSLGSFEQCGSATKEDVTGDTKDRLERLGYL